MFDVGRDPVRGVAPGVVVQVDECLAARLAQQPQRLVRDRSVGAVERLAEAAVQVAASGQQKPSTREWFADARNYALYANDGGQYDDLAKYLKLR